MSHHLGRAVTLLLLTGTALTLPACKKASDSLAKVIGGDSDLTSYPATVGLRLINAQTPAGDWTGCTGTFVRDDLLVTASHCLVGLVQLNIMTEGGDIDPSYPTTTKYNLNPNYTYKQHGAPVTPLQLATDLSFVYFPAGTASGNMIAKFAQQAPQIGDAVAIVGYGRQTVGQDNTANYRQSGHNKVADISAQFSNAILLTRDASGTATDQAVTAEGDSGGPLYNSSGDVIGTVSLGNAAAMPQTVTSIFVNTTFPAVQAFITAAMAAPNPYVSSSSGSGSTASGAGSGSATGNGSGTPPTLGVSASSTLPTLGIGAGAGSGSAAGTTTTAAAGSGT